MKRKLDFHLVESDGLLLIQPKPWVGEQSSGASVYILETRYWYGATETSRFVSNNRGEPLEFETIKEARAWIESADGEVYYLDNECAPPSYKVVSI